MSKRAMCKLEIRFGYTISHFCLIFLCSYQKTASALSTTAEKTTSIFGGLTSGISSKITQMKKSDSYRTLEEKVDSAYNTVKVN